MNSEDDNEVRLKEIVRLIEADHKATTDYISRIVTLRAAARGVIFPLASALAGLALVNKSWIVAAVAVPTVIVGILAEARTDFLLSIAHRRQMRLEYKVQAYLDYLIETGTVAADAEDKFSREIDSYQFGISRSLRGSSIRKTMGITVRTATFWLYCVLLLILAAVGAIVVAMPTAQSNIGPRDVCLVDTSGASIHIDKLPEIRSGTVSVTKCP